MNAVGPAEPRARRNPSEGHGVRQLFQYGVLAVLVVVTAVGLAGLLGALFGRGGTLAVDDTALARSIAFSVVGTPLLVGVAAWCRRTLRQDPAERRSAAWILYLTGIGVLTLLVGVVALHGLLAWAVGLLPFDPDVLAAGLVWPAVWGLHWWLGTRAADRDYLQPHHLIGSGIGLFLTLVGLGTMIRGTLDQWWGLAPTPLLGQHELILEGASTFVVGGGVWWTYWIRGALHSPRNPLWHSYVLLGGAAAGLLASLVGVSLAAHRTLVWLLGEPWTDDPQRYFGPAPAMIAAAVVGALSLLYHRAVSSAVARHERDEVDRIRDYLLAGVGLAAAAAGSIIVLVALVEAIARPSLFSSRPVNTLLAALTLLGVGTPVWWLFWGRAQRIGRRAPAAEFASPVRRTYLFTLLGVASLATVAALLSGAWLLVEGVLEGDPARTVLGDLRYPLGVLGTAAAVASYHWTVLRATRQPATFLPGPRFVVLLGVADAGVSAEIGRRLGGTVLSWTRHDVPTTAWGVDRIEAAIGAVRAPEILVMEDAGALRVIPIERRPPAAPPT